MIDNIIDIIKFNNAHPINIVKKAPAIISIDDNITSTKLINIVIKKSPLKYFKYNHY